MKNDTASPLVHSPLWINMAAQCISVVALFVLPTFASIGVLRPVCAVSEKNAIKAF